MSNCIDILYLPHHEPSEKHRRMSIVNRSAQFSSFKALEGFDDAINLNNVTYDKKITLEDDKLLGVMIITNYEYETEDDLDIAFKSGEGGLCLIIE